MEGMIKIGLVMVEKCKGEIGTLYSLYIQNFIFLGIYRAHHEAFRK